jgi:hypothetical protein
MSFNDNDNWQIDPFIGTLGFVPRVETHTVRQYSNYGNRFGVQVDYNILFTNPSTVSIPGYTEVAFGVSPSINQFRVDYDNLRQDGTVIETIKYKNTAFIEFNAGANGSSVTVTYRGTGRVVTGKNLANFIADQAIPGGLEIEGELSFTQDADAGGNKITNGADGTNPGDFVTLRQLNQVKNTFIFGTWQNVYTFTEPSFEPIKIFYSESDTRYVVIANEAAFSGSPKAAYSSDLITWNFVTISGSSLGSAANSGFIESLNLYFVFVGTTSNLFTSSNGISWTNYSIPIQLSNNLAYSPSLSRYVIISPSGSGGTRAAYSSNLTSWTNVTSPSNLAATTFIWSSRLSLFVALANRNLFTSPDGITWTQQSDIGVSGDVVIPRSMAENDNFLFATKYNATSDELTLIKSSNGITWTNEGVLTNVPSQPTNLQASYSETTGNYIFAGSNLAALYKSPDIEALELLPFFNSSTASSINWGEGVNRYFAIVDKNIYRTSEFIT